MERRNGHVAITMTIAIAEKIEAIINTNGFAKKYVNTSVTKRDKKPNASVLGIVTLRIYA